MKSPDGICMWFQVERCHHWFSVNSLSSRNTKYCAFFIFDSVHIAISNVSATTYFHGFLQGDAADDIDVYREGMKDFQFCECSSLHYSCLNDIQGMYLFVMYSGDPYNNFQLVLLHACCKFPSDNAKWYKWIAWKGWRNWLVERAALKKVYFKQTAFYRSWQLADHMTWNQHKRKPNLVRETLQAKEHDTKAKK